MFFWYCWRLVIWSFCSREIPYTNIKHYILFANQEKTDRIHLKLVWRCGSQTVFLVLFSFFSELMIWSSCARGNPYANIRNHVLVWNLKKTKKTTRQMTKTLPRDWGSGARPMVFLKLVEARASKLKLELQRASTSFNELQRASLSSFIFCEALKNQKNEKNWIVNYLRGSDFQRKHSTLNYS